MQRDPLADEPARGRPIGHPKHHKPPCFRRCPFNSLVISNIETTFLPSNTASSFSSARMLRLSLGSWSSCLRMYSQSFLVSSVRGSGSLPTTAASAASGCTGLLRAFLGVAAFFGVGIGQLERAGLGCQAKNQPCFSGSWERQGESQPIVLGLFIRELISFGNTQDPTSQVSAPSGPSGSPRSSGWHESCITST